jgi:O-antigen chain-terminating methyltransferase
MSAPDLPDTPPALSPGADVDVLMARIRRQVAERRADAAVSSPGAPARTTTLPRPRAGRSVGNWVAISGSLEQAEQSGNIGQPPEMKRFPRPVRGAARLAARGLLRAMRFLIAPQRAFNVAVTRTLRQLVSAVQGLERLQQEVEAAEQRAAEAEARNRKLEKEHTQLKTTLLWQERRLSLLLEEVRRSLPSAPMSAPQVQAVADEARHALDVLYLHFEDQFRGSREEIKDRQRTYLPLIREALEASGRAPVLDVGCGRGEWLELLREEGIAARGMDSNRVMLATCRQHGLEVDEGDLMAYLRGLPAASLSAVTGFHVVEHLPVEVLVGLLDEVVRVLRPGGVAIFETPNPQNVLVGSFTFYLDPTHRNPIPALVLKFLAEARGLCRVNALYLHPYPEAYRLQGSDVAERFNEFFYGPQDYAVVGWKV